jgi:hypothetical protein
VVVLVFEGLVGFVSLVLIELDSSVDSSTAGNAVAVLVLVVPIGCSGFDVVESEVVVLVFEGLVGFVSLVLIELDSSVVESAVVVLVFEGLVDFVSLVLIELDSSVVESEVVVIVSEGLVGFVSLVLIELDSSVVESEVVLVF